MPANLRLIRGEKQDAPEEYPYDLSPAKGLTREETGTRIFFAAAKIPTVRLVWDHDTGRRFP
jgi:hypothetical protein